jgi:hypothetical protein
VYVCASVYVHAPHVWTGDPLGHKNA